MNNLQLPDKTQVDLALIKRTVAPGATDDQLAMFIHDCNRRGVHPLDKLIVFTNAGGRYTPICTIDYLRARAAESGEMAGSDEAVFTSEGGKPVSARVTVYRLTNGARFGYAATARFQEYYRNSPTWNRMPYVMIAKCAEALALRKAFPHQLAGLYTREEMQQAGIEDDDEPAPTSEDFSVAAVLADAAEGGTDSLALAWRGLTKEQRKNFEKLKDEKYKPRAIEVDARLGADSTNPEEALEEGGAAAHTGC